MEPYATTWRVTCASLVAVWLIVLCVYWPTAASMVTKWYESGTFAHGFLIPPVALYFAWRRRRAFLRCAPAPEPWAAALLVLAGLLWLVGDLAAALVIQQAAFVAIVELVLWMVVGFRATWALAFPLVFLWFVVPFGEFLTSPLQDFTAWFAVHALRLSGVPVLVEGRALTIPSGYWLVAEACSGVRYVIPSIALGLIFARLTYRSWQRRLGFLLLSIVVPVLANGMRAYTIIMLAHLTHNRLAVGVDHLIYGWIFFAVVMLLLFLAGGRWREEVADDPGAGGRDATQDLTRGIARIPMTAALAALLAVCPPVLNATLFADLPARPVQMATPAALAPWATSADQPWQPRYAGADAEVSQSYASGDRIVHLYVAHYTNEHQGAELINDDNRLDDGKHWVLIGTEPIEVRLGSQQLPVRQDIIRSHTTGATRLAWTWYWVSGHYTLSPVTAKLLKVRSRLLRRPYNAAAVVLTTDHSANRPAQPALQDFLDHCPSLSDPATTAAPPQS